MAAKIELIVPQKLLKKLEEVEAKTGMTKNDIIVMTLTKVLEELEEK